MPEYASGGEPRRSMALLWGRFEPPARGPRQGLDLEGIVASAIALADTDGLDGVSMRKVAERVGCSAMALYTYVPGKAELLDLMIDRAHRELLGDVDLADGWRAAAEAVARELWAFYERHPWVLRIRRSRAVLGPSDFALLERHLRVVDGLGLTPVEMTRAVSSLTTLVAGAATTAADARDASAHTGVGEDEWWLERSSLLEEVSGPDFAERHPITTRLEAAHAFDQVDRPDPTTPYLVQEAIDTFEFGLQRLLDGLEALVASRARGSRGRRGPRPTDVSAGGR